MGDSVAGADQGPAGGAGPAGGTFSYGAGPPPSGSGTAPPPAGGGGDDHTPEPGELKFKEKRSWRTWQLVVAILVAALVGMWINGSTGGGATTAAGSTGGTLPPSNIGTGSSSASTTTTAASGASSASTTTTVAGGSSSASTTTTVAGGSTATSTPVVVGPNTVLIPATQLTGDWTSPNFTIAGGTWNIGWAFQCTPVPATTPTFAVYVVPAGGTVSGTSTPAVTSSAAQGQSVTPQTSTGSQQVVVQAPTGCRWAIKVTGFSG